MAALGPAPDELMGLAGGPPPGPGGMAAGPPPGAPPAIPLGGPGGGPPGGPGGLPPELMAALAGEGGPPPGGPPEDEGAVPDMGSELDILDEIRVAMLAYLDHDGVDDIERAEMTKALQTVQKLLAKNQQEEEAATGTTPAMKGMRRAIGG